jgi:hypothetical protein
LSTDLFEIIEELVRGAGDAANAEAGAGRAPALSARILRPSTLQTFTARA